VLPKEEQARCLGDLIEAAIQARARSPSDKPANFDEWNIRNVGERLNEIFMRPYNFKVWAVPTTKVCVSIALMQSWLTCLDELYLGWRTCRRP
jgi:UDP-galactopyranose mutase